MPKITVLPHEELCPEGVVIDAAPGGSLCDALLEHGIEIEHACEQSRACTTCHVVMREGYDRLEPPEEEEEDLLDRAWGLEATSRLSCQVMVGDDDLVIQIPRYTINQVSEAKR
jgi:2Fe-2S ferredoxin